MIALLCLCVTSSQAQPGSKERGDTLPIGKSVQLLQGFDFNAGGYALIGQKYHEVRSHHLTSRLRDFYTEDTTLLNLFKQSWVFDSYSPRFACGYHYRVMVVKQKHAEEDYFINLACSQLATDTDHYYFDEKLLAQFIGKVGMTFEMNRAFNTLAEGRAFRDSILQVDRYLMVEKPDWVTYEGKFEFSYRYPDGVRIPWEKRDSLYDVIRKEIETHYPGEPFKLWERGSGPTEVDVQVICNKSLEEKFKLYHRNMESSFDQWSDFEPRLKAWVKPEGK